MQQGWKYTITVGLGVLLGAGLVLFWPRSDEFERAAQRAEAAADSAFVVADSAVAAAAAAEARAVLAEERAARRDTVTQTVIDSILTEPAADTAERRVWVAITDSLRASNADLTTAINEQKLAIAQLRLAVDTLTSAVQTADSALALRPRVPHWGVSVGVGLSLGPGVFAGFCTDGQPCAGAGATANVGISLHIGRR